MDNMVLTVVLPILLIIITWILTRYSCRKSCRDLSKLAKDLTLHERTRPEKAAAKLLLELIYDLEKGKIYWGEFTVFAQTMTRAGHMASDAIEHIYSLESQRTVSSRVSPREAQSIRKMEIARFRHDLEEQLKR